MVENTEILPNEIYPERRFQIGLKSGNVRIGLSGYPYKKDERVRAVGSNGS